MNALKGVVLADSSETCPCSWLINWNHVFSFATNQCFMPESTQQVIPQLSYKQSLLDWLAKDANVHTLNVYSFAQVVCKSIGYDCKLVNAFAHFLCHSLSKGYLSSHEIGGLCNSMPVVDNYGQTITFRHRVLLPASVSNWANLCLIHGEMKILLS